MEFYVTAGPSLAGSKFGEEENMQIVLNKIVMIFLIANFSRLLVFCERTESMMSSHCPLSLPSDYSKVIPKLFIAFSFLVFFGGGE